MAIAFGAMAFLFPAGIKTKIPGIEDTGTSNTHEKRIDYILLVHRHVCASVYKSKETDCK